MRWGFRVMRGFRGAGAWSPPPPFRAALCDKLSMVLLAFCLLPPQTNRRLYRRAVDQRAGRKPGGRAEALTPRKAAAQGV